MRTTSICTRNTSLRAGIIALTFLCAAAVARPALAGPPLLCHPFDIGAAKSLPWSGASSWFDGQAGYDIKHLADDTVAILTPAAPVIVRMETLRRAAIYASRDTNVARQLLLIVTDRTRPDADDDGCRRRKDGDGVVSQMFDVVARLPVEPRGCTAPGQRLRGADVMDDRGAEGRPTPDGRPPPHTET